MGPGRLPSVRELNNPRRDKHKRMLAFYAKGQDVSSPAASRPTLNGWTSAKDSVVVFFALLDRMEEVRRVLVDKLERQEIRSRILERDPRIRVPKLGQG